MDRRHYLPATGRSAVAATRFRWSRRMLVAVAAAVLGLLNCIQGLAQTSPAVVQAAQPDQRDPAAPAGGLAGTVQSTNSGPKDYPPNLIVQSTGAPDERLDVAAALDQGTRLFLLQARYQDAGNGQADYYLAGPQGVSHQPLRELFAPLREWLAAPRHEHEMVRLGLRTDPRSANPARFDAACQAFTSALGQYLLKATDLPAGKSLAELTRGEQAALYSQPRVITSWSACTGEEPPIRRPQAQPAAAVPVEDHWMADQWDSIGQRPLRQVVIPGSHDAATYDDSSCPYGLDGQHECWPWGPVEADYTKAQSQDITAQLNAGSRYLDLRFSYFDQGWGYGGKDFYNFHGTDKNNNPNVSYLKMSKVLVDIVNWINQPGHELEIVWLDLEVYREDQDPSSEQGHLRRHPRLATRSGQSAPVEHAAAQHGADRHVDERDLGAARSPADHRHRLVQLHGRRSHDDGGRLRRRVLGPIYLGHDLSRARRSERLDDGETGDGSLQSGHSGDTLRE